ncbi:MAG: protoporphyrinogen oxidase [Candidatus Binataceae bacterium]
MATGRATRREPPRIAVVGGGITGLAAAYRLRELAAAQEYPLEVTLLEAGRRLGGALDTIRHADLIVETGADSILSEKPWAIALAKRLGLESAIVRTQEQYRKTLVVRAGRLVAIPEGFSLMAPTWFGPVLRSPLFSPRGKLRMLLEPFIPRRRAAGDESLASLVTRRLGREVLERVAQPLAAGIYTADPAHLSAHATMPRFVAMERQHGSLVRGLRAAARGRDAEARGTSGARWSLFVSFNQGVGTLVDALAAPLGDSIRHDARVTAITRNPSGNGGPADPAWRLTLASGAALDADAIICTAPAFAAVPLVEPHDSALAAALGSITYASAVVVNLAFRAADFPTPPVSFGFVVPITERRTIIAGSFSSLKFPGRAPFDLILARAFLGGALQTGMTTLDDDALIAAARDEFRALLGVTAPPLFTHVRRWPESMPQYAVGHLERVKAIRAGAAGLPGVILAGAYLDGVGIPDCVRMGEAAAAGAFAQVGGVTPPPG